MTTVPVSIENLIGAVNTGPGLAPANDGKDNFQALLDLGGPDDPLAEGEDSTKNERKPGRPRDEKPGDPIAVAIAVPTTLFITQQPAETDDESIKSETAIKLDAIPETPATPKPIDPKAAAVQPDQAATPQNAQPVADETLEVAAETIIPIVTDPAATIPSTDPAITPNDTPYGQLQSQVNHLSKTLSELMQMLTRQFRLDKIAPGLDPLKASDDQLAVIAKALAGNTTDPASPYGALYDLLKHMRDVFAKLQDTVQSLNPSTDLQTQFNNRTQALSYLDMLEADIEQLPNYLPPQPDSNTSATITDLINHALKYIASVRDLLQSGQQQPIDPIMPQIEPQATKDDKIIPFKGLPKSEMPEIDPLFKLKAAWADIIIAAKETPRPSVQPATTPIVTDTNHVAAANTNVALNTPAGVVAAALSTNTNADTGAGNNNNSGGNNNPVPTILAVGSTGANAAASPAGAASFARLLNQPQQTPVMEQVSFHIKTALTDGSSKIRIQLDPAELGKLEIKLHVTADGKTGMIVTADNKETLAMLQRDSRGLEQALIDAGLKPDSNSLSFNLRGGQQEQGEFGQAAANYQKNIDEEEEVVIDAISQSYVINLAEGLDIKI
jgi:flagellar hook-length control protein FliK